MRAGYYDNILYMTQDGTYGNGQTCSGGAATIVRNNTIYSPTGNVSECGMVSVARLAASQLLRYHFLAGAACFRTTPGAAVVHGMCRHWRSGRRRAAIRTPPRRRSPQTRLSSPSPSACSTSRKGQMLPLLLHVV